MQPWANNMTVPLRLPHRRRKRRIRLHPSTPGLAIRKPTVNSRSRARHRTQRILRRPRPNRRGVDLQEQRSEEGIPDRALDERGAAAIRNRRLYTPAAILRVEK